MVNLDYFVPNITHQACGHISYFAHNYDEEELDETLAIYDEEAFTMLIEPLFFSQLGEKTLVVEGLQGSY